MSFDKHTLLTFFGVLVSSILAVEIISKTKPNSMLRRATDVMKKAYVVMRSSKVSDHWKEKVVPVYGMRLFVLSVQLLLILLSTLIGFFVFGFSVSGFLDYCLSAQGIFVTLGLIVVYSLVRRYLG